ncbi:DUF4760 domain-containing protein [Spiribacter vilamensis]|uniref:DUF4760 domain-containing protein n=1 Tax=Spiribacter vilamensis TaxID=531306 RepID=UPI00102AE46E|nr:DUF4760 domain-containing protein [Spiribacter vilamensis]TVO60195.1 DUF4760 domain-containing protein [Spiribacter vilamensis]
MTTFEIASLMIAVITAAVLVVQVGFALKALNADHGRRKKQATFEFVQKIRPAWLEARHERDERWGKAPLASKDLKEIENDFQLMSTIRSLLGILEHLSVGMNSGVFDKDLLYIMSGSQLISTHKRFRSYIDKIQQTRPTAYTEFGDLVRDFEERKRMRPITDGNIANS